MFLPCRGTMAVVYSRQQSVWMASSVAAGLFYPTGARITFRRRSGLQGTQRASHQWGEHGYVSGIPPTSKELADIY
jgi:hypothetical protein